MFIGPKRSFVVVFVLVFVVGVVETRAKNVPNGAKIVHAREHKKC